MKSIGMIVAVEMDAVLSRYGRAAGVEMRGGFEVHRYEGEDYTLHIVSAGAGEIAAAAATELLIAAYGAELVVNFGVVGGLTEEMALARTVLVESVVHYDFDTSAWDGCEVGRYAAFHRAGKGPVPGAEKRHLRLGGQVRRRRGGETRPVRALRRGDLRDGGGGRGADLQPRACALSCRQDRVGRHHGRRGGVFKGTETLGGDLPCDHGRDHPLAVRRGKTYDGKAVLSRQSSI